MFVVRLDGRVSQILCHAHAEIGVRRVQVFAVERNSNEAGAFVQGNGFGLAGACFENKAAGAEAAGFLFERFEDQPADALAAALGATYIRLISATPGSVRRTAPQPTGSPAR